MSNIFSLVIITPEETYENETSVVKSIIEAVPSRIHIRKPSYSEAEYRRYLKSFENQELQRMVIHEHYQLLEEFPALCGVHWKDEIRKNREKADQKERVVSTSFHSVKELQDEGAAFEYVFLSPVFDSISKSGHNSAFDLDKLKTELDLLHQKHPTIKIIALGGISPQNINLIKQTGFDGIAVIGSVWKENDPVEASKKLFSSL